MRALNFSEAFILQELHKLKREGELESFYWSNQDTIFSELIEKYNLLG